MVGEKDVGSKTISRLAAPAAGQYEAFSFLILCVASPETAGNILYLFIFIFVSFFPGDWEFFYVGVSQVFVLILRFLVLSIFSPKASISVAGAFDIQKPLFV